MHTRALEPKERIVVLPNQHDLRPLSTIRPRTTAMQLYETLKMNGSLLSRQLKAEMAPRNETATGGVEGGRLRPPLLLPTIIKSTMKKLSQEAPLLLFSYSLFEQDCTDICSTLSQETGVASFSGILDALLSEATMGIGSDVSQSKTSKCLEALNRFMNSINKPA